jgi:hypothetical protein
MSSPFKFRPATLLGGLSSLIFWLCLFAATALYAAATLSPKLLAHETLRARHETSQWQLVSIEQHVERLRKVIAAQKGDPAFVREQARTDFELSHPDEQRIPVEPHLMLQIGTPGAELAAGRGSDPVYLSAVRAIASSCPLRDSLLAAAAILIVAAFTLLPPGNRGSDLE